MPHLAPLVNICRPAFPPDTTITPVGDQSFPVAYDGTGIFWT